MPTVIALDVSLSMTRLVSSSVSCIFIDIFTKTYFIFMIFIILFYVLFQSDEPVTYHQLAVHCINRFLDYLSANSRLEYTTLVK